MHSFSFDPPLNQDTSVCALMYALHTLTVCLLCIVLCIDTDEKAIEEFLASNKHVVQMWGAGKELNELQRTALKQAMVNRFQLIQGPPGVYCRLVCTHDCNVCSLYPNYNIVKVYMDNIAMFFIGLTSFSFHSWAGWCFCLY